MQNFFPTDSQPLCLYAVAIADWINVSRVPAKTTVIFLCVPGRYHLTEPLKTPCCKQTLWNGAPRRSAQCGALLAKA